MTSLVCAPSWCGGVRALLLPGPPAPPRRRLTVVVGKLFDARPRASTRRTRRLRLHECGQLLVFCATSTAGTHHSGHDDQHQNDRGAAQHEWRRQQRSDSAAFVLLRAAAGAAPAALFAAFSCSCICAICWSRTSICRCALLGLRRRLVETRDRFVALASDAIRFFLRSGELAFERRGVRAATARAGTVVRRVTRDDSQFTVGTCSALSHGLGRRRVDLPGKRLALFGGRSGRSGLRARPSPRR